LYYRQVAAQTYVVLMKLTDQGMRDIKQAPQRIQDGISLFEHNGGKVLGFFVTMGEYDYVALGEAPNDGVVLSFCLTLGAGGNVRTTTLRGFPASEFEQLVGALG
jgi:uncharacterized protein with GYD domain